MQTFYYILYTSFGVLLVAAIVVGAYRLQRRLESLDDASALADHKKEQSPQEPRYLWGPLSVAIPIISVVVGFLFVASGSKGVGGDMVGLGFLLYAGVGVGIAGIFGEAAAIRAIMKGEDRITLAFAGLFLNLILIALGVLFAGVLLK